MSRFTKLAPNAFQHIQLNAGLLMTNFVPATGAYSGILGVSSGGLNFTSTPSWKDFGEDMDNCPKNTFQLKRKESEETKLSGSFTTVTPALARILIGTADIDSNDATHIVPRFDTVASDFLDLWLVGDYSEDTSESTGGFVAIHMFNGLSTGGFQIQTADKDKGKFAFEFTGHYDYNSPNTLPYEIYIQEGTALGYVSVKSVAGTSTGKTKLTVSGYVPSGSETYVYKTAESVSLPAKGDSVASGWTDWNGTDEITATTGNDIAVVVANDQNKAVAGGKTVVVSAASTV